IMQRIQVEKQAFMEESSMPASCFSVKEAGPGNVSSGSTTVEPNSINVKRSDAPPAASGNVSCVLIPVGRQIIKLTFAGLSRWMSGIYSTAGATGQRPQRPLRPIM
ncbi:MAG: hypothetical protein WBP89_04660, partial [Sedimenticolaceae bacterium]